MGGGASQLTEVRKRYWKFVVFVTERAWEAKIRGGGTSELIRQHVLRFANVFRCSYVKSPVKSRMQKPPKESQKIEDQKQVRLKSNTRILKHQCCSNTFVLHPMVG